MNIGIIGAGNIGGILTRRLTALGHHVSVANSRGPETLAALAAETGAVPMAVEAAARGGRRHRNDPRESGAASPRQSICEDLRPPDRRGDGQLLPRAPRMVASPTSTLVCRRASRWDRLFGARSARSKRLGKRSRAIEDPLAMAAAVTTRAGASSVRAIRLRCAGNLAGPPFFSFTREVDANEPVGAADPWEATSFMSFRARATCARDQQSDCGHK